MACGAPALLVAASLTPDLPLGRCQGSHRRGELVPISVNLEDIAANLAAGQPTRARRLHARHLLSKLQPDRCHYCAAMVDAVRERRHAATT